MLDEDEKRVMADLSARHRQTRFAMHQRSFWPMTGVVEEKREYFEDFDGKLLKEMKFPLLSDFLRVLGVGRMELSVKPRLTLSLSQMAIYRDLWIAHDSFSSRV